MEIFYKAKIFSQPKSMRKNISINNGDYNDLTHSTPDDTHDINMHIHRNKCIYYLPLSHPQPHFQSGYS